MERFSKTALLGAIRPLVAVPSLVGTFSQLVGLMLLLRPLSPNHWLPRSPAHLQNKDHHSLELFWLPISLPTHVVPAGYIMYRLEGQLPGSLAEVLGHTLMKEKVTVTRMEDKGQRSQRGSSMRLVSVLACR